MTIPSAESVDGDGLSTTLFPWPGKDWSLRIPWMESTYRFIDEDYNVYYSDGMEDFIIKAVIFRSDSLPGFFARR